MKNVITEICKKSSRSKVKVIRGQDQQLSRSDMQTDRQTVSESQFAGWTCHIAYMGIHRLNVKSQGQVQQRSMSTIIKVRQTDRETDRE